MFSPPSGPNIRKELDIGAEKAYLIINHLISEISCV